MCLLPGTKFIFQYTGLCFIFLWAVAPLQSLSACTRVHFTFYFLLSCFIFKESVPWPRQSIVELSERSLECSPRSIHVRCPLDILVLGRVFFRVIRFSLSMSLLQCSIHIFIYTYLLPERQRSKFWEHSQRNVFSEIGEHRIEKNLKPVFIGLSPLILYLQIKTPNSMDVTSSIEGT